MVTERTDVLEDSVSHHAHEHEADKLFPRLRKQRSEADLAGIGNDLLARFEVPSETRQAAPLPA
jgi:hypothetical protein